MIYKIVFFIASIWLFFTGFVIFVSVVHISLTFTTLKCVGFFLFIVFRECIAISLCTACNV